MGFVRLGRVARPGPAGAAAWALGAGLLHTASFAPLDAWGLQIAALALLVALARDATPGQAARLGWWFGVAWLTSGLWWLYLSMHRFGGMPAWMAAAAVVLLAALLALYYAAALALWAAWRRRVVDASSPPRLAAQALAFAGCWLGAELARAVLFTGFPWIAGGYAHTTGPLAAWAPWIGVYGIGALAAWLAAGLAMGAAGRRLVPVVAPVLLIGLGALLPHDFTQTSGRLGVTLLQPNVAQDAKFDTESIRASLAWHTQRLALAKGALVVSPESSLPLLATQIEAETWAGFELPFRLGGPNGEPRGALLGVFTGGPDEGYMNSAVGLSKDSGTVAGRMYRYGKRHLLPFGEFIPPGFGWFVAAMNIPIGDQTAGRETRPFVAAGQRIRPLICYEQLFGEDFAAGVVGPDAATVLVNMSNLAWFGTLMVQDQDLQFSRMRALEFQRPLLRSTNTGSTAAVDHRGVVLARLPPEVEGVLDVEIEGRRGDTPYARWLAAAGLWPLWLTALLATGPAFAAARWRRRT